MVANPDSQGLTSSGNGYKPADNKLLKYLTQITRFHLTGYYTRPLTRLFIHVILVAPSIANELFLFIIDFKMNKFRNMDIN